MLLPKNDIWSRFLLLLATNSGRSWKSVFPIAVNFAREGLPSMILLWQLLQPLHKSVHVLVVFESARVAAETELEEIYLSFLARGSCSQEMSP